MRSRWQPERPLRSCAGWLRPSSARRSSNRASFPLESSTSGVFRSLGSISIGNNFAETISRALPPRLGACSMSDADKVSSTINGIQGYDFDPDALRDKYREERDRRLRTDGNEQYVEVKGD